MAESGLLHPLLCTPFPSFVYQSNSSACSIRIRSRQIPKHLDPKEAVAASASSALIQGMLWCAQRCPSLWGATTFAHTTNRRGPRLTTGRLTADWQKLLPGARCHQRHHNSSLAHWHLLAGRQWKQLCLLSLPSGPEWTPVGAQGNKCRGALREWRCCCT